MRRRIASVSLVALAGLTLAGFMAGKNPDSTQPIAYNHYKHVEENGMDCLDCHQFAEENSRASIPNIRVCVDCHEEAITESEEELKLLAFINEQERIPWRQVTLVPDYAYFSHRRHVKLAQLECAVCHGDVGKLTEPVTQPLVQPTMQWCMDCHQQKAVSDDCYACHR